LYRYTLNSPTNGTDPTGESFLGDYWYYLTNPGAMDSDLQTGQQIAVGTAITAGSLATAGLVGQAVGGVVIAQGGGSIAAGAAGGLAGGVAGDLVQQGGSIAVGAQPSYNPSQTAISGGLGLLGGAALGKICGKPPGRMPANCFVGDTPVLTDEAMAEGATIPDGLAGIEASDETREEETAFRLRVGVVCISVGLAIGIRHAHSAYRRRNRRRDVELIDAALEEGLDAMPTRKPKGRGRTWDSGRTPSFKPYIPRLVNP